MSKPVDIYLRVSRVGKRQHLMSPAEQEASGRAFADQRGLSVGKIIEDIDESGGKANRPGIREAIERVSAGRSSGLVVAYFDRFSRDVEQGMSMLREIDMLGGKLYAPNMPEDFTTAEGEFQVGLFLLLAQRERKIKAEGFERAKVTSVAAGIWTAPKVPLGFVKDEATRKLVVNGSASVVREAFELRAGGASLWTICKRIEALTGEQLDQRRVEKMLCNRVYLGESRQGKHVNAEAHPAIIDRALWEAAQRKPPRQTRSKRAPLLLSGLARCATCGKRLTSHGGKRDSYICSNRIHCSAPSQIIAHDLNRVVQARVLREIAGLEAEASERTDALDDAMARLAETEQTLADFASPEVQAAMSVKMWAAGLATRERAVEQASEAVGEARAASPAMPPRAELESAWPTMPADERRVIIAAAIGTVYVRPGRGVPEDRVVVLEAGDDPGAVPLSDALRS